MAKSSMVIVDHALTIDQLTDDADLRLASWLITADQSVTLADIVKQPAYVHFPNNAQAFVTWHQVTEIASLTEIRRRVARYALQLVDQPRVDNFLKYLFRQFELYGSADINFRTL